MNYEEQIQVQAEKAFGSKAKADAWLNKPKAVFDGLTPLQLSATDAGFQQVSDELVRIDESIVG